MTFSLSRLFGNLGWLSRNSVASHLQAAKIDLGEVRDTAAKAKALATDVKQRQNLDDAIENQRSKNWRDKWHVQRARERAIEEIPKLRAALDQLRADVTRHVSSTHFPEVFRERVAVLEKALASREHSVEARLGALDRYVRSLETQVEAQKHEMSRVVADARAAVRRAFDELENDPTVVSAAFTNAERFTEMMASTIDRN